MTNQSETELWNKEELAETTESTFVKVYLTYEHLNDDGCTCEMFVTWSRRAVTRL